MQRGEFVAADFGAEPDHADVLETWEDAQTAVADGEGVNSGVGDRSLEFRFEVGHSLAVDVAEEFQRHVGLLGINEIEAARVVELVLQVGDRFREVVRQVDADEETHTCALAAAVLNGNGRSVERWLVSGSQGREVGGRTVVPNRSCVHGVGSRVAALNSPRRQIRVMTDREGEDTRDHRFSEGEGFEDPYDEFDLDPPELDIDPSKVDPVDSRVVTDTLDSQQIASDDVDASELLDVGLNYMQINRYEQATDAFERTARFADDERLEQEAWVNKGVAHAELEEWDAAIGAHREALDIDDQSEHAATAETNLAYALWEFGETAQALEHAERAIEIDERFAEGWFNRAFFLSERGLAEEALQCIDNAIRLGLRNAKVLEEKAEILEELGEYDEAEEIAEEANEMREQAEQEIMEDRREMEGQPTGVDELTEPSRETDRDREWELE